MLLLSWESVRLHFIDNLKRLTKTNKLEIRNFSLDISTQPEELHSSWISVALLDTLISLNLSNSPSPEKNAQYIDILENSICFAAGDAWLQYCISNTSIDVNFPSHVEVRDITIWDNINHLKKHLLEEARARKNSALERCVKDVCGDVILRDRNFRSIIESTTSAIYGQVIFIF